jgi:glycosyltransferase involved in cell wall biosynthesis
VRPAAPSPRPYALLVGSGARAGGARKKGLDLFAAALAGGRLAGLDGVLVDAVGPASPGPWRVALAPDDAALAALLAGARLVVVPSRSEGFGYPLLEAFAAGVPVVAAAAGALPEVSGGAAHLVPPGDADALLDGIARVHADEGLRAGLVAAGRARAREFPPEAMARAWLDVLGPLAESA